MKSDKLTLLKKIVTHGFEFCLPLTLTVKVMHATLQIDLYAIPMKIPAAFCAEIEKFISSLATIVKSNLAILNKDVHIQTHQFHTLGKCLSHMLYNRKEKNNVELKKSKLQENASTKPLISSLKSC